MLNIAIPVYEGVDLLDVAGPYEMFSWVNDPYSPAKVKVQPRVVSADGHPVTSGTGLTLSPQARFADLPHPEILWVPGGSVPALHRIMKDPHDPYLEYLREAARGAQWVCSVCEGALLAARAGLLDGHEATTHWSFIACLASFPEITVASGTPRYVLCGNRLTGGGISSGLDESLRLIELVAGTPTATFVQELTQYFPEPPVHGSVAPDPDCPVSW
jgi:cyclohexyl-isocyanide hydratase